MGAYVDARKLIGRELVTKDDLLFLKEHEYLEAACKGDLVTIRRLVAEAEDEDQYIDDLQASMVCAVRGKHVAVINFLLDQESSEELYKYIGLFVLSNDPDIFGILQARSPILKMYYPTIDKIRKLAGSGDLAVKVSVSDQYLGDVVRYKHSPCFPGNKYKIWLDVEKYVLELDSDDLPVSVIGVLLYDKQLHVKPPTGSFEEWFEVFENDQDLVEFESC